MFDQSVEDADFQGGVFCKELPNGRASANITLDFTSIRARTTGGDEFVLRYGETNLEMGGSSGRMVFCRNADKTVTIFCEDKKFPKALENASSGELRAEIERVIGNRKQESRRGWGMFWIGATVCVLLLIGGYFGIKQGAKAAVHSLPFSVDETIGELSQSSMQDGFKEVDDPKVVAAIEAIVERLEPYSAIPDVKYQVRVLDSPIMNAYALPGGYITVFTGLIAESESAEEVAGVIAHEMAHVTKRHGLERVTGQLGIVVGIQVLLGDVSGLLALGVELGQYATQNSYSRLQETEADLEGARMLYEANIDPLSVVTLFEDLKAEDPLGLPAWLSTHPDTQGRIDRLKDYAKTLPVKEYDTYDDIDWADIKSRLEGDKDEDADKNEVSKQEDKKGEEEDLDEVAKEDAEDS
jgi:Zn-dependent protease with chaperone function